MLRAEEYRERRESMTGWPVRIVSYRLGDHWRCEIDNVDPGLALQSMTFYLKSGLGGK